MAKTVVQILFNSKHEVKRERERESGIEKFPSGGLVHSPNSRNPETYSGGWASVVTDGHLL